MTDTASIPIVQFHEQVTKYFDNGSSPESAVMKYREMAQKYKIYESSIEQKLARLILKINEINSNLDALAVLGKLDGQGDEPIEVDYEVGDTLYAKAVIQNTQKVHLWIGANTLMEFGLEEAGLYLNKKLEEAAKAKDLLEKDMKVLKEQITTCEVTTARIYNHIIAINKKRDENKRSK